MNNSYTYQSFLKSISIIGFLFFSVSSFSQTNLPCAAGSPAATVLPVNATCTYQGGTTVGLNWGINAANGGAPSCATGTADGWYQFTAPASGSVTINTLAGTMFDGVMALYSGSCGAWTELACNDNGAGMPSITSTTLTPGALYMIRIWQWNSGAGTFSICIQGNPAAGNPCSGIANIAACGTSVTSTLNGAGVWNVTACGFTTSGNEMIYSFTPTVTGTYSINVTAASGGYIDYFWMPASSGCASTGWNCIDDVFGTGSFGAMSWTAGVTYYILLDAEPTTSITQTFNIPCIVAGGNPCTSITNIGACGTAVTTTISGTGIWNVTACGFTTSGNEVIYSFTPTTTGTYSLNVTSAVGGFVDYFWMDASTGCGSAGWTCIDDVFSAGIYGSMNWTAGVTYYILMDPEPTSSVTQTFTIPCPSTTDPCLGITNIPACGTTVNNVLTGTGAWPSNPCFGTPGQELVYSFTPSTTGVYSINVNSITGGFIDFGWSTTCASTGWACIDDVISAGNYGALSMTAGTTYYIIVDAESTAGNTFGFSLNCPGTAITAGDCPNAVNVCNNMNFAVDPNGFGAVNELTTCSVSNPCTNPASANSGCLNSGELNSTWMVVNIATPGTFEFSFGAAGGPIVCYDWIMWAYSGSACANVASNSQAPVRCNWNVPCAGYTGISTPVPAGGAAGNFEPELNVVAGQQFLICFSNYSSATTSVPLNFFGTATVSCTPLSTHEMQLIGNKEEKAVELKWKSSSLTTKIFTVQHSINGFDYSNIATVNSEVNKESDYVFYHSNPTTGDNFYRIIETHLNDEEQMSNAVKVEYFEGDVILGQLFPNPSSSGEFNVSISSSDEKEIQFTITDITGKEVKTINKTIGSGQNTISLSCEDLAKGIYTLRVSDKSGMNFGTKKLFRN